MNDYQWLLRDQLRRNEMMSEAEKYRRIQEAKRIRKIRRQGKRKASQSAEI